MNMSTQIQPYGINDVRFDRKWLELILLEIADAFNIQVIWDNDYAVLASIMGIAGGLLGGFVGGRSGALFGAGLGSAAGLGMAQVKPLREVWAEIKDKLEELLFIVYNFLRRFDAVDYINAFSLMMACIKSRQELVKTIISFITHKLGRQVLSTLNSA